jgi:lipid-A-disaccharide synthase
MPLIYLVAGEQSGDILGARLMQALAAARPDMRFAGVGGAAMQAAGLASLFPMQELALMGLLEVLPRVWHLRRRLAETLADIQAQRPDVVVTIDSPGFTLRVLRGLAGSGLRRVHYVAPQVWAWREHRVRHYGSLWDQLLCLLPFEPPFFAGHGLPATFVGHPVLESGADQGDADRFRGRHGLPSDARLLTMLPGSRRTEVRRMLPLFQAVLQRLPPDLTPVMPTVPTVAETVRAAAQAWPIRPILVTETADKHDAFAASAAALTKSGTSALELAMAGLPMVVTYKVHPLTAAIVRRTVKVRFASLINIIADREVVPELIQADATPDRVAAALRPLLTDPAQAAAQRAASHAVLDSLRPGALRPSEAAAAAVLELLIPRG